MQSRGFLPMLVVLASVAACSSGGDNTFPSEDTGVQQDATVDDAEDADVEDVIDIGFIEPDIQPIDVPGIEDTGIGTNPPDAGFPETDTGTASSGVCPAACGTSTDCDPCWGSGEAHMGNNYCCVSGLCIFRTGTCDSTTPTDGGTSTGTDAAAGGG